MKNYLVAAMLVIAFAVGLIFVVFPFSNRGGYDFNRLESLTVGNFATATNTAQLVLPANSGRVYAMVINDSTSTVYLWPQATSTGAIANRGIRLNASSTLEFKGDNLYMGNIWLATNSIPNLNVLTVEK